MKKKDQTTVEGAQLVMEGDEQYSARPKSKPEKVIRGKLLVWPATKQYYFEGQKEHPEMKREVMHDKGGVRIAKTVGEKESSFILTSKIPSDVTDPYGTFMENIAQQIGPLCKEEPKESRAVYLIDRPDELLVWQKRKARQVKALLTLDMAQDKELVFMKLSSLMSEINKIVYSTNL